MAVYRARNCPHCGNYFGVTIAKQMGEIAGDLKTRTPLIGLSDILDTTPAELIPLVKEFGFEGIIARRKDSCYEAGKRSGAWLKYKVPVLN